MVCNSARKEFLAFSFPSVKGKTRAASDVFVMHSGVNGEMYVQHPGRTSSAPSIISHLAVEAKIREYGTSANSVSGILKKMELYAGQAQDTPNDRGCCLKVALGAKPLFPP